MRPHRSSRLRRLLSRHRFKLVSLSVALAVSALHVAASFSPAYAGAESRGLLRGLVHEVQRLEGHTQDFHHLLRGVRRSDPRVVVVAIDEKSVQRYGRWPWRREVFARGVDALHDAGASAIGLDAVFVDEDRSQGLPLLREALALPGDSGTGDPAQDAARERLRAHLESLLERTGDAALERAFARAPEVVQTVVASEGSSGDVPPARLDGWAQAATPFVITSVPAELPGARGTVVRPLPLSAPLAYPLEGIQPPLPRFLRRARHLAQIQTVPDADGVTRGLPLFAQLRRPAGLLPSLGLETAAVTLGARVEPLFEPAQQALTGARLVRDGRVLRTVPLPSNDWQAMLDYPGPGSVFTTYSFADVLDGKVPRAALEGKAVLVGVTLTGELDQVVTPFEPVTAGVYEHASLLSNVLSGRFLAREPGFVWLEVLFLLGSALLYGSWFPRLPVGAKTAVAVGAVLGWFGVAQLAFDHGHLLATLLPCLGTGLSAEAVILIGYVTVDREKFRLERAFSHYLSPAVMAQMLAHPERLKLGGEEKEMTVLFSDIRGFTTLAERMTPEALVTFINTYLTPMTEQVLAEGGTLDKYIGDALMAFWGAPIDQEDHALRACRTALRFLETLKALEPGWRAQGLPAFDIGVGINSGPMIVGNMGSDVRFDYTVMGDAVNLASRLEGTNKDYGTRVMISEVTFEQVKGRVRARRLGAVRVKGKRAPVRIYELRGLEPASGTEAEAIARFEAAVDAFAARRFEEAAAGFRRTLQDWPEDGPCQRYLSEIERLKQCPPDPEWDGVYASMTK